MTHESIDDNDKRSADTDYRVLAYRSTPTTSLDVTGRRDHLNDGHQLLT